MGESQHVYINISQPWELGGRQVCWATEWLGTSPDGDDIVRRCILDAQTHEEIQDPIDVGSHVMHPTPGGPVMVHRVVDADPPKDRPLVTHQHGDSRVTWTGDVPPGTDVKVE